MSAQLRWKPNRFNQDTINSLLASAIQAPSADNHHRIRFQLVEDALNVRYSEPKLPPPGSYKRVLALMSLGAVAENLTIAASHMGIQTDTVLFPEATQPDWIMQARLWPAAQGTRVDPLFQAIPLRHTNRNLRFHGPKMTSAERGELDAAAGTNPANQLLWLEEPLRRSHALRLMRRAETERFRNSVLHQELFSAIRFDVGWRAGCPTSLPPGALAVEPPLRPLFALLRHWPVMRLANLLGAHHLMGWRSCDLPCRLAPHLGMVAVTDTGDHSVFSAGRNFQRLWLAATKQGRVLQPMPASALFALEGARLEGIPADLQQGLKEGWKTTLGSPAIPVMLFRMGFAKPSAVVAGRREVAHYWPSPRPS